MKETFFKNQLFKVCLIIFLTLLVLLNIYTFIFSDSVPAIVRAICQFFVLLLIVNKSKHAKLAIYAFAIITIVGSSIALIGSLIKLFIAEETLDYVMLAMRIILLGLSIAVFHFNSTTVIIKTIIKEKYL
ncbi:hypothetical protein [Hanstruepera ponticola]|uniref:hypothetical protein n=1 Tax=Hanstruepera ponticola TaxID=2042995 RepID=UPI000CF01DAF|nr:hypothetical protein [Hanstruepera ponticola]